MAADLSRSGGGGYCRKGGAKNQPPPVPVHLELKAQVSPIGVRQYTMSKDARDGIMPHIIWVLQLRVLCKCQSDWNTLLLQVRKPGTNDCLPVQDLGEVNKWVADLHLTYLNPISC